jgi:hypothetical protein
VWGGQNFTQAAGQVSLEQTEHGAIMCAEMRQDRDRQEINLSERIKNFNGRLDII